MGRRASPECAVPPERECQQDHLPLIPGWWLIDNDGVRCQITPKKTARQLGEWPSGYARDGRECLIYHVEWFARQSTGICQ
jgi:hypothetical protein